MRSVITALLTLSAILGVGSLHGDDSARSTSVWDAIPGARVKRDAAGQVIELDLRKCERAWLTHVDQLASVKTLRNLKVAGPAIDDAALEEICTATQLRALFLQQCGITDAGCEPLGNLVNLKELALYGCPVGGGALAAIRNCKTLTKLNLRATAITDADLSQHLPALETLQSLELSETEIGDASIDAIAGLPKLVDLNLWKTQVSDAGVAKLTELKLKRLNLDNIPALTDAAAQSASQIPTLEFLHLGKTGVSDAAIDHLMKLEKLAKVHLNDTQITPAGIQRLKEHAPDLEIVY